MQEVSRQYKQLKKRKWINQLCYMRVTIGVINQKAQASACIEDSENFEYYSDFYKVLNNYQVSEAELYVSCDEDYTKVDSGMYFLPREKDMAVLNQGIVTRQIFGTVTFSFPSPCDIKGLTIEFGKCYPVDFEIQSNFRNIKITGNEDGHFVTDEIFEGAEWLKIIPFQMRYGNNRLRIHQILMGMGIFFSEHDIQSASRKEYVSPVSEELPTLDFSMTVDNRRFRFDIENPGSSLHFLEIGQKVEVLYGQELDDGTVEWISGSVLKLSEWEADEEKMSFSATDGFDDLNNVYYKGFLSQEGISLYDLAVDVFTDAGIELREVWIDPYLRQVYVHNPIPPVKHKEALQLIANAGRCVLSQGRNGKIYLKSSFMPELTAKSDNEIYYADTASILGEEKKAEYASVALKYTGIETGMLFVPSSGSTEAFLPAGYVSNLISDAEGRFLQNPSVVIYAEARYKCFGMTLEFGRSFPEKLKIITIYDDEVQEEYVVTDVGKITVINHEFPEWDQMVLEFLQAAPHSRIVLHHIRFGESTDYRMEYSAELKKIPTGRQLSKVKEVQILRTVYNLSEKPESELVKETVMVDFDNVQYTFYFDKPSYSLSCKAMGTGDVEARIVSYSCYCVTVEISGGKGETEITILGKEYGLSYSKAVRQIHSSGTQELWENPLVSDSQHAENLAEWIGDYLKMDKEYSISCRGDARLDGNDRIMLESRCVDDMKVRIYSHTLTYDGTLSGEIMARRVE